MLAFHDRRGVQHAAAVANLDLLVTHVYPFWLEGIAGSKW
jgi:hypothetical protein